MLSHCKTNLILLLKLYLIAILFLPLLNCARGLNEMFELYNAPQALGMGNALTADASGYLSNYYNPAGHARAFKKRWEIVLFSLDGLLSSQGLANGLKAQSFGMYRLFGPIKDNPGKYTFLNFAAVPAACTRGFGFSFLASSRFAAMADGSEIDMDTVVDVGPSIGMARNFAGNLFKIGISTKFLIRNQIKGKYAYSAFDGGDDKVNTLAKEGFGMGGDVGMLLTFPNKYLPTLGLAWKDVLGTHFSKSHILNPKAGPGTPEKIPQSIHAGFSIRAHFSRQWKSIIALEFRHIERVDLPLRQRAHFGVQFDNERSWYFWLGLNQLYATAGVALRLPGGNLEMGTYGTAIGGPNQNKEDRRFFFRYTIGF